MTIKSFFFFFIYQCIIDMDFNFPLKMNALFYFIFPVVLQKSISRFNKFW